MACSITISGRGIPCRDAIGGIKRVWIGEFDATDWGTVTAGALAGAVAPGLTVYGFDVTKNSSSLTQTINASAESGSVFYSQVLEITVPKIESGVSAEIADLVKTQVVVIVDTMNGDRLVLGHTNGALVTGGTIVTGQNPGDLYGYTLTFTAEEKVPAPGLSAVTNITFTPGN